jgi:hypothetical protein
MPRAANDYIPRPDGDFDAWQEHYIGAVASWLIDKGIVLPLFDAATQAQKDWQEAYPAHAAARAAAQAARAQKDAARAAFERAIRPVTAYLQSDPAVTDADRASFGITVRDPVKTPAPAPRTCPVVTIDPAARLTHRLRITDSATPTRRGKPEGAVGAEVWVALVPPGAPIPTDPAALSFLTLASRGVLRTTFEPGAGGKTAVYMLRWVNTKGERGPWSEVGVGTVAA